METLKWIGNGIARAAGGIFSFMGGTVVEGAGGLVNGGIKGLGWGGFLGTAAGIGLTALLCAGGPFSIGLAVLLGGGAGLFGAVVGLEYGAYIGGAIGLVKGGVKSWNQSSTAKTGELEKDLVTAQMNNQNVAQKLQEARAKVAFNNENTRNDFVVREQQKKETPTQEASLGVS